MFDEKAALSKVLSKLERTTGRIGNSIPYRTIDGKFNDMTYWKSWWTNGFYPGILWLAYRHTHREEYAELALAVEKKLDEVLYGFSALDHDIGFMWHLSSVADYKLTGNEESAGRSMIAASFLASRFNPAGNFIRAWNLEDAAGWAIIDCMMNLPLLFWASEYTKDPRFYNFAQAHAETVMKNFIYEDGSSKHVCEFDPVTGDYVTNSAGQGYSAESAWSRGASWALYGFALSAKYTGRQDFLNTSIKVANYFIAHLPEDSVPMCDFKAPKETNIHKDSSAAAIAASGLLVLSRLVSENERDFYINASKKILKSLYENYTDWDGDEALLQKGCVAFDKPDKSELETSLIYGDYFFLEALLQLNGEEELF